jgi:uncharacterized protein
MQGPPDDQCITSITSSQITVPETHPNLKSDFCLSPLFEVLLLTSPTSESNAHVEKSVAVARLLILAGAEINACDQNNQTILFKAACLGSQGMVELLVRMGAEIDAVSSTPSKYEMTPLACATNGVKSVAHTATALSLINLGADVNFVNDDSGQSILIRAAPIGSVDVVRALLRKGADAKVRDKSGKTALDYAIDYGNHEVAKLLQSAGQ